MFKRNQKARTRLEIIEDELEECQEMLEYFFLERDIALELNQDENVKNYNSEIKAIGSRKIVLKKIYEDTLKTKNEPIYFQIPATIHVRNSYP